MRKAEKIFLNRTYTCIYTLTSIHVLNFPFILISTLMCNDFNIFGVDPLCKLLQNIFVILQGT
jgi:hypothetical protein